MRVPLHPHRTAPLFKGRVNQVHHQGLAAAGLPGHEHHHRVVLSHRARRQLRHGHLGERLAVLLR
ncbi:hypothetical protein [Streptomyces niveus]